MFPTEAFAKKKDSKSNNQAQNTNQSQKKDKENSSNKVENENISKKDEAQTKNEERKFEHAQLKEGFKERMYERATLRNMKKDQLQTQREIAQSYKKDLQYLLYEIKGITEEEQAEYEDELATLAQQILDVQRYCLEIKAASKVERKQILPGVRSNSTPDEEDVEAIIDEVIGEL